MYALTLVAASAVVAVPREYHIDCSGWPGTAAVKVIVCATTMDGTAYKLTIEFQPNTTPEDVRDVLALCLKENLGLHGHKVAKGIYVLEGAEKSGIRSVEFTSKGWKPDVRMVFKVPEKK